VLQVPHEHISNEEPPVYPEYGLRTTSVPRIWFKVIIKTTTFSFKVL